MLHISPEFDEEIPQWDVALQALLREEYNKLKTPLTVADVRRLATQYIIRFDDLMFTLFELTVQGHWRYQNEAGVSVVITREHKDALWAQARPDPAGVAAMYPGGWRLLRSG
jgi:hypothetical protein